ncbi:MAG TPA: transcriptional regulator [Nitrospiraceae bacterium]|nr:transcriptional regulator [Nitrospiraceae bacterium]
MSKKNITVLTDLNLITCIVQKGAADDIIKAVVNEGIQGATIHYARGTGIRERLGLLGVAVESEKEVINIVVSTEMTDRVFEAIYFAGKLDTPGMGIMYVTPVLKAGTYIPENLL